MFLSPLIVYLFSQPVHVVTVPLDRINSFYTPLIWSLHRIVKLVFLSFVSGLVGLHPASLHVSESAPCPRVWCSGLLVALQTITIRFHNHGGGPSWLLPLSL